MFCRIEYGGLQLEIIVLKIGLHRCEGGRGNTGEGDEFVMSIASSPHRLDMIVSETLRSSSRSSAGILAGISRLRQKFDGDSRVLLFALSSNAPDLSQTVNQLGRLATRSIGCLSAPEHPDVVSCSVALLDAREATVFRSDIPGRAPAQVGRWHSPKRMQEKTTAPTDDSIPLDFGVDWEEVWSKGVSAPPLPKELQKLQLVRSPKNDRKHTPDVFCLVRS